MNDFKPGLEGVVAVETEIAEPDREGGSLRYRGVDIEGLVGHYPYENVWGLLVDDDLDSKLPDPEPYEPARLTGNAPADLQAETARLAGEWRLGKLNEISDPQAREDLGRLSAQMMSIVAMSARVADGNTDAVPDDVVGQGKTAAEKFLLRWRGEADPKHARAIDTYWICTAEHGLNPSTFTARVVASTGADCGAALSSAVGALSGPLHGGAPAYVKPMLEEVSAMGDAERWVQERLASGQRIMGFGHRVYRAEDPRSRLLKSVAKELGAPNIEVAEELEQVALAALQERRTRLPAVIDKSGVMLSMQLPGTPQQVIEAVTSLGLEGVIAKRRTSTYIPGERHAAKCLRLWLMRHPCLLCQRPLFNFSYKRRETIEHEMECVFFFVEFLNEVSRNRNINQLSIALYSIVCIVAEKSFGFNNIFEVLKIFSVDFNNLIPCFKSDILSNGAYLKASSFVNFVL